MTAEQNAFFEMCAVCIATANAHNIAWASFAPFADPWALFMAAWNEVTPAQVLQNTSSKGATTSKDNRRIIVESNSIQLSRKLYLIGLNTNNDNLQADAKTNPSDLDVMGALKLAGRAAELRDLAEGHETELDDLDIDAAWLTAYDASLAAFRKSIGTPRHHIAEAVRGTQDLAATEKKLRTLLSGKLDPAVDVLDYDQPAFASEWRTSRRIVDAPTHTRALTVRITDQATGQPLAGAQAVLEPGGLKKKAGEQGGFYLQSLPAATYTLTVKMPGYADHAATVPVGPDGGVEVEVKMVAA